MIPVHVEPRALPLASCLICYICDWSLWLWLWLSERFSQILLKSLGL